MQYDKQSPLFLTLSRLHFDNMEWIPFLKYCPNICDLSLYSWYFEGHLTKDGWIRELSNIAALATRVVRLRINAAVQYYAVDGMCTPSHHLGPPKRRILAVASLFPALEALELHHNSAQGEILVSITSI